MNFARQLLCILVLSLSTAVRADVIQTDLCVYGATSGGIAAAIQATRMGKSVVLISTNDQVGGMTTAGLTAADIGNAASIGGIAAEFLKRVNARYGLTGIATTFESQIADQEFRAMLTAANVPLRYNQTLSSVTKIGSRISEIAMASGDVFRAAMFIDATYEGDLMAAAGVPWTLGRESSATYGESLAGVGQGVEAQFNTAIDPYVVPGNPASGLLSGVQSGDGGVIGAGDTKLQAYNYRLCLTQSSDASKRVEISPATTPGYKAANYEILARLLAANPSTTLDQLLSVRTIPGGKADVNNNGAFSTDLVGGNYDYITSTPAQRAQIALKHRRHIEGLLYFLKTDPRVPVALRLSMSTWAYAKGEFSATGGWPHQLYVREGRRMISDYVMQQGNCLGTRIAPDGVGLASFSMDSHLVQRFAKIDAQGGARVYNEGGFYVAVPTPYPVSLRSILPRQADCENLAVPFALSASHVAFGSIRMEPVFMILSQSAATTAAFAIDAGTAIQSVPYAKVAVQLRADRQVLSMASPTNLVVDDTDPGAATANGTWGTSTSVSGYYGTGYKFSAADGGAADRTFRFTPNIPESGNYFVQMRWTSATNRATNVPVEIVHANGTFIPEQPINQRSGGGTWYSVTGAVPLFLNAGMESSLLIRTAGTNGIVVADSVRFVAAMPTVQIVATNPVTKEMAPADPGRFTVVRDASQTANAWTVNYAVSGTATAGTDYVALTGSVVIPAGEVSASIPVTAISDSEIEGTETVVVTLVPGANYVPGNLATASVQILDTPVVAITATDPVAREEDVTDTATFTVSRALADSAAPWTVYYSLSGTATAGLDYVAPTGSVILAAGQTAATITITPLRDALAEGPETVTVTLAPGAGFAVAAPGADTATILDRPVDAWRASRFTAEQLADLAISGDDADPDGDGIQNLTEYALGLDPLTPEPSATLHGLDETGALTMTYLQRRSATDVTIIPEGSSDLLNWASGPGIVEETSREVQGEFDRVTVRLMVPNLSIGFLRVRVTRP